MMHLLLFSISKLTLLSIYFKYKECERVLDFCTAVKSRNTSVKSNYRNSHHVDFLHFLKRNHEHFSVYNTTDMEKMSRRRTSILKLTGWSNINIYRGVQTKYPSLCTYRWSLAVDWSNDAYLVHVLLLLSHSFSWVSFPHIEI